MKYLLLLIVVISLKLPVGENFLFGFLSTLFKNVPEKMEYFLYTRSDQGGVKINSIEHLNSTSFDCEKPIKFITHGYKHSGKGDMCMKIKNGFLKKSDVNIIVLNWEELAYSSYSSMPFAIVPDVAFYFSKFIEDMIITYKVEPSNIHLIGHSLGAQIFGLVHESLNGIKLGRVTGLDPALPGFLFNRHISRESAEFVDVIHTDGGFYGVLNTLGHVDFYPNGGTAPQPGCSLFVEKHSCSHQKAWKYFADSLFNLEKPLLAVECNSWMYFSKGKCEKNEKIIMGDDVPLTARGKFYLETTNESPYSLEKRE